SQRTIEALCTGVDNGVLQDFFTRMDEDYFSAFSPEEIASHIRMSCDVESRHPLRVRVTPRPAGDGEFDVIIVGFDYLSEFSITWGLMWVFGVDIRSGNIYSLGKQPSRSRRKIVDVFSVAIKAGAVFDESKQREFEQELETLAQLLAASAI